MLKTLFVAAAVAAATLAPQNDSIRQDDLRADLFFLAGDSLRGRLTDTEENGAAADFIRSRFERMGLKPAAPNNSYFQGYNLMTATLGDGNALDIIVADGASRHLRSGQDFYPQRISASGRATGDVVFAGFGITAPRLQYDDYNGDVRGRIVLALDHEPGERDPNSPFDGVVTSEWSTLWRKVLAAQQKGARAVLFVSDVHNHPGAANFEAAARNVWPEMPARILIYTLAAWADRIHIPVAQISPALAASLVAGTGKSLELKKRYDNNASQLVRRSDQWPFLQSGVPALGFMTGLHPDYHTQYDRPEKIKYAKLEKIARLIHQASWEIANADSRPNSR